MAGADQRDAFVLNAIDSVLGKRALVEVLGAVTDEDRVAQCKHGWRSSEGDQGCRAVAGEYGEVHVCGFPGLRPRTIEVVGVAVEEPQTHRADRPAQCGKYPEQDAAVASDHQRASPW